MAGEVRRDLACCLLALACWVCPSLAGVRYDQSQTGDYNVHLDLKNIEVLAFLDGSSLGASDYDYDYGEYTLKPPSNSSGVPSGGFGSFNSTGTLSAPVVGNGTNSTDGTSGELQDNGTKLESSSELSVEGTPSTKPPRRCGAGFYRDPAGRCRRLRRPIKLSGLLQQAKNRISR